MFHNSPGTNHLALNSYVARTPSSAASSSFYPLPKNAVILSEGGFPPAFSKAGNPSRRILVFVIQQSLKSRWEHRSRQLVHINLCLSEGQAFNPAINRRKKQWLQPLRRRAIARVAIHHARRLLRRRL